ncbi:SPOR domain-containing protein [Sinomicrobium soli]|uniref:SPOR domain-containing protein n=1 Tax=Sinomicrobium sp. N-1-3-6 TaxID=2219864 RepID=UPI000DCB2C86|nr:SPOR domain-containing protein [Sinomicrobium sp. N-1-3-6]RAV28544.1 SPOR domain-containing protein [Sinomicrobium sp. N-1-3-6]
MRFLYRRNIFACLSFLFMTVAASYAQEGKINIRQDAKVEKLLAARTELNEDDSTAERYRIQIYNGNLEGAQKEQSSFKEGFDIDCDIAFKTPTYRVYAGKFRTRLEADRHLIKIKNKYPSAFIITP